MRGCNEAEKWKRVIVIVFGLIIVEVFALVDHVEVVVCAQLLPDVRNAGVLVDIGIETVVPQVFGNGDHSEMLVHAYMMVCMSSLFFMCCVLQD